MTLTDEPDRDCGRWRSIVLWPDFVSTGRIPNESTDEHDSYAAAMAVCLGIQRDGLGGDRQIFPLSTRVERIEE